MPEGSRESERAMRRRRERMVREQWLDVREEWERTNNRGGNHDAGHVSARPLEDSVVEEAAQGALSAQPALNPSRLRHRCLRESRINRSDNVRGVKWLEKTLVPPMCCREKGADTAHCCLLPAFGSGSKSAPSTTILFVAHSLATSTEAACERAASAATAAATARFFFSIVYLSCLAVGSKDAPGGGGFFSYPVLGDGGWFRSAAPSCALRQRSACITDTPLRPSK